MKRLIFIAILLFAINCQAATSWGEDPAKGYVQAVCVAPNADKAKVVYTCCLYSEMEDDVQLNQWVLADTLAQAKKTCARGGANPCDCLGVGVHGDMTYSYEGSASCMPNSPIYQAKGEISTKDSMASLCKAQTASDQVVFVGTKNA